MLFRDRYGVPPLVLFKSVNGTICTTLCICCSHDQQLIYKQTKFDRVKNYISRLKKPLRHQLPNMNTTEAVLVASQHFTGTVGLEPNSQNIGWVVFQIVFYVCVIVLGIPGNGLILRVYWTKSGTGVGTNNNTSTFTFVKALAVSDLIVCLFRFRNLAYLHAALTDKPVSSAILYLEIPDKIAICFTVVVTGVIAFDRYDCVCRPYSRLLNHRRALVAAVGCGVFVIVANAPLIFNILIPSFLPVFVALMIPVFQVVTFLIVFIMIIVCYTKVYRRIRQHVMGGCW